MEKELLCRTCKICLTDENKVTKENICKSCNKIKNSEWRIRKKNNEPPIIKIHTNCSICNIDLTDNNRLKYRTYCKECRSNKYQEYKNILLDINDTSVNDILCNKCSVELNPENQIKGRKCCKPCDNKRRSESKKLNKDTVNEQQKVYYEKNKDNIKEYYKEHYINNKETYLKNNQKWRDDNRDIINEKYRKRLKNDENLRLKKNLRKRLHTCIKKDKPTMKYIGCDLEFLKKWLSYNFKEGMSFENYGPYWHMDHVIPCSKFNFENEDDIYNSFIWYNLQPLESTLNMSKHDKINSDEFINHYKKIKKFATENNIKLKLKKYKNYFNEL